MVPAPDASAVGGSTCPCTSFWSRKRGSTDHSGATGGSSLEPPNPDSPAPGIYGPTQGTSWQGDKKSCKCRVKCKMCFIPYFFCIFFMNLVLRPRCQLMLTPWGITLLLLFPKEIEWFCTRSLSLSHVWVSLFNVYLPNIFWIYFSIYTRSLTEWQEPPHMLNYHHCHKTS